MSDIEKDNWETEKDSTAATRKEDHIDLAFNSAVLSQDIDQRFNYEPILSGNDFCTKGLEVIFGEKSMRFPIWISSMTGGTEKAKIINRNLAQLCQEFGLGMGLGSCRQLLYEDHRQQEFDVRQYLGDQPLYTNLGIAQIEELTNNKALDRIIRLNEMLSADGLIIHINPLQEWLQPEGDVYRTNPLELIQKVIDKVQFPIIVKEVGQGFGPKSLKALLELPLQAVELAGFGGTNFSKLELMRTTSNKKLLYKNVFKLGHTCDQMIGHINEINETSPHSINCKMIIASGGVKDFLDGYYHIKRCKLPTIYAQASSFLKYALDYAELKKYCISQIEGIKMANSLLSLKAG